MRNCVLVLSLIFLLAMVGCGSSSTSTSSSGGSGSGGSGGGGNGGGGSTPSTVGDWTWMGGSQSYDVVPTSSWPGATEQEDSWDYAPATWVDSSGNFWLFGGGIDANGNAGYVGTTWKMSPSANYEDISWSHTNGSLTIDATCGYGTAGVWGTRGVAAPANTPSGRNGAATWVDSSGNFWLFGGSGCANGRSGTPQLNDLWMYSPTTGEWTWVSGPDTIADGGTTAADGNPGVYGTRGVAASANIPGGRQGATTWTDASGNLWLYGGYGCDSSGQCLGLLADLWRYSPTTGEWTWVSGPETNSQNHNTATDAVYGTQGVAAAGNTPGGRQGAVGWRDADGNLWLYGGTGDLNTLDDLWRYSPSTGEWAWMGGHSAQGIYAPSYGTKGVAAGSNTPGSRANFAHCSDSSGNLWMFGGAIYGGEGNDLWMYSPSTGEWTWEAGSDTADTDGTSGVYGTEGVASADNVPPARSSAACWFDTSGNLWVFGGAGADLDTGRNDLWYYQVK